MQSQALSADLYIAELPEERKAIFQKLRATIREKLPQGFEETMQYGMISYVVPHTLYPAGYHCDPNQALPFLSVASQKNFIAFYHMALYADPELYAWFTETFAKTRSEKLDMGKSCVRFKKPDHVPLELLGQLCAKMSPSDWIRMYEERLKR